EAWVDRLRVVDAYGNRTTPPAFAVEDCELVGTVGQGVALAPLTRRAERQLTAVPEHGAPASQAVRLEPSDGRSRVVARLDPPSPEAAAREPPRRVAGPGGGASRGQPLEAQRADSRQRV